MGIQTNNCILCGSSRIKSLKDYTHCWLSKCKDCDLVFSTMVPSHEELNKHYSNYPRYTVLSPITIKRYNDLLDKFEPFRQTNNLIDLGCSNGLFLECAKKRGWQVYGTEYDAGCIEYGKRNGIKIFKSDDLPKEIFEIKFDVVTSFEVIEHINTPNDELSFITQLLRKGGITYITTPNFNSISRFYLRNKWNVIEYPEHLTYYTPKTFHSLMNKYGYRKVYLKTTGIAISRFRKSLGKKEPNGVTEKNSDEVLREHIEKRKILVIFKSMINAFLNVFKIGDAMKGLYLKE